MRACSLYRNGECLVSPVRVAETFFERTRGLLGREEPRGSEGFLILHCNMVHMFFMRYAIDVVFLSESGEIVGIRERLRPWRVSRPYSRASRALELGAGAVAKMRLRVGERLDERPLHLG